MKTRRGRPPLPPELRKPPRRGGQHADITSDELATRDQLKDQARAKVGAQLDCPPDRVRWKEVAEAVGVRVEELGDRRKRRPAVDAALRRYIEADPNP